MSTTIRTFFAIPATPEMQRQIQAVRQALQHAIPPHFIRWLPQENWHITLHFVGNIEPEKVAVLCAEVRQNIEGFESGEIQLGKPEFFPNLLHPRVVALRVTASPSLYRLSEQLNAICQTMNLRGETRHWRPHVSLGYVKQAHPFKLPNLVTDSLSYSVTSFSLIQSECLPQGAQYTLLATFGNAK